MKIERKPQPQGSLLRSRSGVVFLTFAIVVGFLLAYEHRAHVFTGNAVLFALLGVCILMHVFMHGGHGRHGDHPRHEPPDGRTKPSKGDLS